MINNHLLMSRNKAITNIDNNRIQTEDMHELLEITIDSKLTFEIHINLLLFNVVKWSDTL